MMPPRDDPFLSSRGFPRASGTPRPASTTTARVRFPGFRVFAPVRLPGPEGPVAIGRALPVTVAGTAAASTAFPKPRALSGTLGAQRPDRQSALYKKRRRHAKARSCEEFEGSIRAHVERPSGGALEKSLRGSAPPRADLFAARFGRSSGVHREQFAFLCTAASGEIYFSGLFFGSLPFSWARENTSLRAACCTRRGGCSGLLALVGI